MARALKIGFLGAGKMATALAQGFLRGGLALPEEVIASDVEAPARERFTQATGATTTATNRDVAAAPTLVVSVKPGQVAEVLHEIWDVLTSRHLLVSIAAGVTLAKLEQAVPAGVRIARVMPNTPALVLASASAIAVGANCTPEDSRWVHELFGSVGLALTIPEVMLDAVTGVSGSGPAYAYLMIEALSDGAVAAGLPRDVATRLAAQTLLGASRMVLETGLHPGTLKDQVTSPGGTTIEGLYELERAGVRAALISAVRAATEKSRRMGQG